jgi:death-on-curing family protein
MDDPCGWVLATWLRLLFFMLYSMLSRVLLHDMTTPSATHVLRIHESLVEMFADSGNPIFPSGPRDVGLVESACARPNASMAGIEQYNSVATKSAALFHSLVKSHPFHNGNKRTALVSLIDCLFSNDRVFRADISDDEFFAFVIAVADNRFPADKPGKTTEEIVAAIASWIRENSVHSKSELSEMSANEFIKHCEQAGAKHKVSGSLHFIQGPTGTTHFNRSTRKLSGNVIRRYIREIGLSERRTGVTRFEFAHGMGERQDEIRRFRNVLHQLAHA